MPKTKLPNPMVPSGYVGEVLASFEGPRPLLMRTVPMLVDGKIVQCKVYESLWDARKREREEQNEKTGK